MTTTTRKRTPDLDLLRELSEARTYYEAAVAGAIETETGDCEVKMWSGRFRQPLDPHFEEWQRSFPFDQKLLRYELAASRAHAQALKAAEILTAAEFGLISAALEEIGNTSERSPEFLEDREAEDVHHFVEKKLVGPDSIRPADCIGPTP